MSSERAHAILKRAGYVMGGSVMGSISRDVEDRQDPDSHVSERRAKNDRMVFDPEGLTDDRNERDDRHLPSDLKQRRAVRGKGDQLLGEEPGLRRGGRTKTEQKRQ